VRQDVPVPDPLGDQPGVGRTFLRLGLVSFGGPVAHLGYFRDEVVGRRAWMTDRQYADLVALGQFLPGPASSQVGMGIGLVRAGLPGSVRAWAGFTLPSAVLMIAAGLALGSWGGPLPGGVLDGLKVAAVAVVSHAVLQMGRSLLRGPIPLVVAAATAAAMLLLPTAWTPILALGAAGLVGVLLPGRRPAGEPPARAEDLVVPRLPPHTPAAALVTFLVLLLALPMAAAAWPGTALELIAGCYRAGALVFGGGHVVLPLLEDVAVGTGAVPQDDFLAGYGLANAVPGPLFTFAGFLGARAGGALLGLGCVVAVFLPGYLLVVAALGHWHRVQRNPLARRALSTVNAAVVGLLAAALYDPVIVAGITGWPAAVLALCAFAALARFRVPPHVVVAGCALAGWLLLG
jgi:chromate transporter